MDSVVLAGWCGPLQTDQLAGWIEALSTFGALVVACFALRYLKRTWEDAQAQLTTAKDQLALEYEREQYAERLARRRQAEQISVWLAVNGSYAARNASDHPVYAVYLAIQINTTIVKLIGDFVSMVPSASVDDAPRRNLRISDENIEGMRQARENGQPHGAVIGFRDINRLWWTRRWDGELVEGRERFLLRQPHFVT